MLHLLSFLPQKGKSCCGHSWSPSEWSGVGQHRRKQLQLSRLNKSLGRLNLLLHLTFKCACQRSRIGDRNLGWFESPFTLIQVSACSWQWFNGYYFLHVLIDKCTWLPKCPAKSSYPTTVSHNKQGILWSLAVLLMSFVQHLAEQQTLNSDESLQALHYKMV